MWTKCIALIVVILVLVAILFSQERGATNPSAPQYQLVAAPLTAGPFGPTKAIVEDHRLFLVDSASGNVWQYITEWTDKDGHYHESLLVPVQMKR